MYRVYIMDSGSNDPSGHFLNILR
eukprot:UN10520